MPAPKANRCPLPWHVAGDPAKFGDYEGACTAACLGQACEWFNDGCVIGCDTCSNSGEYYCNEAMPNGEKSSCYPPPSQNGCHVNGKLSDGAIIAHFLLTFCSPFAHNLHGIA